MSVGLRGLTKTYRGRRGSPPVTALAGVDLTVAGDELMVVVGPSGSGKSTLLRVVAGLERPDAGSVHIGDANVTAASPGARNVSLMFQEPALFPHLTVAANIAFGERARGAPRAEVARRVAEAARLLGIDDATSRRPEELSGGERQRVALARAIVRRPAAFLLDEPLAALDAELRLRMRGEIRELRRRLGTAMVYVTHDQYEAMALGDRIAVLRDGRILQCGPPRDLYERPATAFVARFMGGLPMNLLPAPGGAPGELVGVRPERVRLAPAAEVADGVRGRVLTVEEAGEECVAHVDPFPAPGASGERLLARVSRATAPAEGDEVTLTWSAADEHRFAGPDGHRL